MIDQAKGMMMAIYRIDADTAYRLLRWRWRWQSVNVKLRVLAVQIVKYFSEMAFDDTLPQRTEYDHLLMTAHDRASWQAALVRNSGPTSSRRPGTRGKRLGQPPVTPLRDLSSPAAFSLNGSYGRISSPPESSGMSEDEQRPRPWLWPSRCGDSTFCHVGPDRHVPLPVLTKQGTLSRGGGRSHGYSFPRR